MAKLYEYQGKRLLEECRISIPRGELAGTPEQARKAAEKLGSPVVVKAQALVKGRADAGGIRFAKNPKEAEKAASEILGMDLKGFNVMEVLVEEELDVQQEFFIGLTVDDVDKCPALIFSLAGGSGVEDSAQEHPEQISRYAVDIRKGLSVYEARDILRKLEIRGRLQRDLADLMVRFYKACRGYEARSGEINPLVLNSQGKIVAADCHMVIDDYAVFRHPELGIDIAREFDRPANELEKVAYQVEAGDHRGTFYFYQMKQRIEPGSGYIGFHGAGGGGSMMSMDALLSEGFKIANYCDTSGNPSASKVYRAARIILSQKNIEGYFASGSGVASQEQFHSARGLVKAFLEIQPNLPAVIRLGGNAEEQAIEILHTHTKDLPGEVEAYGRDTSAAFCAKRLRDLADHWDFSEKPVHPEPRAKPQAPDHHFKTMTGEITIDHDKCERCATKPCVASCTAGVLQFQDELPVLAISAEDALKGKCTECLACELSCLFHGEEGLFVDLPIPGLETAIETGA